MCNRTDVVSRYLVVVVAHAICMPIRMPVTLTAIITTTTITTIGRSSASKVVECEAANSKSRGSTCTIYVYINTHIHLCGWVMYTHNLSTGKRICFVGVAVLRVATSQEICSSGSNTAQRSGFSRKFTAKKKLYITQRRALE